MYNCEGQGSFVSLSARLRFANGIGKTNNWSGSMGIFLFLLCAACTFSLRFSRTSVIAHVC